MRKHVGKLFAIGVAAVLAVGMLASCGGSGSSSGSASSAAASGSASAASASSASAAAAKGGTLKFGCQMYSDGLLDPAYDTNAGWNAMRVGTTECLFKFDDTMSIQPWLAESCTPSDDHKTWTITLKKGIKFSNGDDLTATAVVESFERLFKEGASGSATPEKYLDKEAKLTADDAKGTVTIETVTPYVDLRGNLAYPTLAIVNVKATTDFDRGVIGTGPYMVDKYTQGVGYTMKANPNYHDGDVPFDSVEVLFLGDATAKANALKGGQVDVTENIATMADLNALKDDPAFTVNVANGVRCGFSYLNQKGILKNDALRQAVITAIDGQTICDVTVGGLYTYGFSVLPSNLDFGYGQLTNPYTFSTEKAKEILDNAGIKDNDGDGWRELDGKKISLVWVTYENRGLGDLAQAGKQSLAEVGIDVDLQIGDSATQWNRLVNGDYDINGNNWTTVGTGDPSEYLANWHGNDTRNYCGYKNAKFDEAYEKFIVESDTATRKELAITMQQCLVDDAAVLVHGYYNSSMIFNASKIANAPIHTADYYWITTEIAPAA